MGLSVANILLEVTGDSSEARRELEDVARDLALFGRETAEAEAELDTTKATATLDELKAKLAEFSADDVSADVNVKIAKAEADLAVLQAELDKIDGENVTVDVKTRRDLTGKIASLVGQIDQLGKDTEGVNQGPLSAFASKLKAAFTEADGLGASLSDVVAVIAPVLIAVLVAVIGQLAAVIASAANAATGLGALAVAFGAVLVPGILLAVGAIAQFKAESGKAGTAAYALAGNLKDIWNTFKGATAGGANAVFQGLSDALRELEPMVKALGPAFTRLGQAGGDAFRLLGKEFSSPAWRKFFVFTTDSLAKLTPLFARSFGAFAAILRNIATAAMPFLIQGFRLLAKGLEAIADKTSHIGRLRTVIGGMVDSLGSWGHLLGGIIKLVGAFVAAFAPVGDKIVKSLGDGAENLAKWLQSKEGLERIRSFFEETGPVAAEFARYLLNVGKILIQVGQFFAPLATVALRAINTILEAFSRWVDAITHLDRTLAFKHWGSAFAAAGEAIASAWGATVHAIASGWDWLQGVSDRVNQAIGDAFGAAIDAIIAAWNAAKGVVAGIALAIWSKAKEILSERIDFFLHVARDVLGVIRSIWQAAKGIVSKAVNFVLHAPRTVLSAIRSIWSTAKGIVTDVINFVLRVPHDAAGAARALWNDVKGIIKDSISFVLSLPGGIVSAARSLWQKVKDAVSGGIDLVIHLIPDVSGLPGKIASTLGFANGVEDLLRDTLAMVGERGPELAFLPQGTDIYTAGQTRNILKALGSGASLSTTTAGATGAGSVPVGGDTYIQHFNFSTPGTGNPDPRVAASQVALFQRRKGRRR